MPLGIAETTADMQQRFLLALADCGSISEAATRAGLERQTHYDWLDREGHHGILADDNAYPPGSYADRFLRAKRQAADRILERSERQSLSDEDTMPNTIARIFHIKRWYPQYRDSLQVRHSGAVLSARLDLNQMEAGDRTALLELALQRERRLLSAPTAQDDPDLLKSASGQDDVAGGSDGETEAGG